MAQTIPGNLSLAPAAVENRCLEDNDFRERYQDYLQSVEALEYWSAAVSEEASARSKEYQDLVNELEQELLSMLLNRGGGDP